MPDHTTEERFGHLRTVVQLHPDEKRVSLCRCFKSSTFPFCDGSHKSQQEKAGPVIVEVLPESGGQAGSGGSAVGGSQP